MKSYECEKWDCNIKNGILGTKRDINLKLIKFIKDEDDIREVFLLVIVFVLVFLKGY
jgi:hypothetical protein